jgi:hypothetical protein
MSDSKSPAGSAPRTTEPDELGPAVRDVSYQLTHDLSDTPADLRDAVAFAPLAMVKLAQRFARGLSRPGGRTALLAGSAAALLLAGVVWARRRRS